MSGAPRRRQPLVRAARAAMGASLLAACTGGGDRDLGRADTAALLSDSLAALDADSSRGLPTDSATADSAPGIVGDSAGSDLPVRVVLRADSAAGDALYHGRGGCLTCHALNGAGVPGIAPSLRDSVWLHGDGSPAMIARVTREGIAQPKSVSNRMPGFGSTLGDAEITRIAAYVFAISHPGGTAADTSSAPGEVEAGTDSVQPAP